MSFCSLKNKLSTTTWLYLLQMELSEHFFGFLDRLMTVAENVKIKDHQLLFNAYVCEVRKASLTDC